MQLERQSRMSVKGEDKQQGNEDTTLTIRSRVATSHFEQQATTKGVDPL